MKWVQEKSHIRRNEAFILLFFAYLCFYNFFFIKIVHLLSLKHQRSVYSLMEEQNSVYQMVFLTNEITE